MVVVTKIPQYLTLLGDMAKDALVQWYHLWCEINPPENLAYMDFARHLFHCLITLLSFCYLGCASIQCT